MGTLLEIRSSRTCILNSRSAYTHIYHLIVHDGYQIPVCIIIIYGESIGCQPRISVRDRHIAVFIATGHPHDIRRRRLQQNYLVENVYLNNNIHKQNSAPESEISRLPFDPKTNDYHYANQNDPRNTNTSYGIMKSKPMFILTAHIRVLVVNNIHRCV